MWTLPLNVHRSSDPKKKTHDIIECRNYNVQNEWQAAHWSLNPFHFRIQGELAFLQHIFQQIFIGEFPLQLYLQQQKMSGAGACLLGHLRSFHCWSCWNHLKFKDNETYK
jgi:hypothetical protein